MTQFRALDKAPRLEMWGGEDVVLGGAKGEVVDLGVALSRFREEVEKDGPVWRGLMNGMPTSQPVLIHGDLGELVYARTPGLLGQHSWLLAILMGVLRYSEHPG